jgi:hypothetical protein
MQRDRVIHEGTDVVVTIPRDRRGCIAAAERCDHTITLRGEGGPEEPPRPGRVRKSVQAQCQSTIRRSPSQRRYPQMRQIDCEGFGLSPIKADWVAFSCHLQVFLCSSAYDGHTALGGWHLRRLAQDSG